VWHLYGLGLKTIEIAIAIFGLVLLARAISSIVTSLIALTVAALAAIVFHVRLDVDRQYSRYRSNAKQPRPF
jgi:hypothetical protein